MKETTTILILEDDVQMNEALRLSLGKAGYDAVQAFDSYQAEKILQDCSSRRLPALLLADVNLPGESGISFYRRIRQKYPVPVIFLTARDEERDILEGYEAGCEEYVTKPVSPKVLVKKIGAVLRRNPELLTYRELSIDKDGRRVWRNREEICLTAREWKVLMLLAENRGRIITKETLLEKVWDAEGNFVDDHAVTVVINRLRKKLEPDPGKPVYIRNIFGVGYTFGE